MSAPMKASLFAALFLLIVAYSAARPRYIDCADSSECSIGHCCVLGMGKFSIPTCMPHTLLGQPCILSNEGLHNATVIYPDGQQVDLTNIYYNICHCGDGLICSIKTGTCEEEVIDDNNIYAW